VEPTALNRITAINLSSDYAAFDYDISQFAALRAEAYGAAASPTSVLYCTPIYSGPSLHNVRGTISVDGAVSSNASLVIFGGFTDPAIVERGMRTADKVQNKEVIKALTPGA